MAVRRAVGNHIPGTGQRIEVEAAVTTRAGFEHLFADRHEENQRSFDGCPSRSVPDRAAKPPADCSRQATRRGISLVDVDAGLGHILPTELDQGDRLVFALFDFYRRHLSL